MESGCRGDERIGVARSEEQLYQECAHLGVPRGHFVVRCIVPELPADMDLTPLSSV